jgi:hypothetical protein
MKKHENFFYLVQSFDSLHAKCVMYKMWVYYKCCHVQYKVTLYLCHVVIFNCITVILTKKKSVHSQLIFFLHFLTMNSYCQLEV